MTGKTPRNYDRRGGDAHAKAEAAFHQFMAKPADVPAATSSAPAGDDMVWLRVTKDVLAYFRTDEDGWQDRMIEALRRSAGL